MSRQLRDVATIHYGKSPAKVLDQDGDVPVIGTGGQYQQASKSLFLGPAVIVPRKGSLGNPQYVEGKFWPSDTTFAVLPNGENDAKWIYYTLDRFDLTRLNEATDQPSISSDWLYKLALGEHEPAHQRCIAEILSTVDKAIEGTEKLIAKHQQIKAGLMHDLFTRGLTPDGHLRPPHTAAPHLYKNSPLGPIPKEWEVVRIADQCSDVVDCPHSTPQYTDHGVPCIRTADMTAGALDLETAYRVTEESYQKRVARLVPRKGDVIYSREGERLGIASPVGDERVCLGQRVMLLRPRANVDPAFLMWAMNAPPFYRQVIRGLGATTSPHVNVGDIVARLNRHPPFPEQQAIGSTIRSLQERIRSEDLYRRKLLSQRGGLMHDLLSGKVKAAAQPESATETSIPTTDRQEGG